MVNIIELLQHMHNRLGQYQQLFWVGAILKVAVLTGAILELRYCAQLIAYRHAGFANESFIHGSTF